MNNTRARSGHSQVPTFLNWAEGKTGSVGIARRFWTWRGLRPCACTQAPCAEIGSSRVCLRESKSQTASENPRTHTDDVRPREVGQSHSTCEAAEQCRL